MEQKEKQPQTFINKVKQFFRELCVTGMVFLLFITFVMQTYAVDGRSMQPTLEDGERLIAEKISYRFSDIEVGDVVILYYPYNPDQTYVKRVVARPGDVLEIKNGTPIVNGESLSEPFLDSKFRSYETVAPVKIPAGYYFVMGDHRNASYDSRYFGFVPQKYILAHVIFRYWPLNRISVVR